MKSAPARASNPSSAASAAAAEKVASGSTAGSGSPRVVASMRAKYAAIAQPTVEQHERQRLGQQRNARHAGAR